MSKYPRVSKGLGKLTPELWARLMKALKFIETRRLDLEGLIGSPSSLGVRRPYFLAKITGNTRIGTEFRYKYSFEAMGLEGDDETDGPANLTGTTGGDDYALNLCEINNTATDVAPGVDVSGSSYPAGYEMQPIKFNPIVVMFAVREWTGTNEGRIRYVFSMANAHDGTCT